MAAIFSSALTEFLQVLETAPLWVVTAGALSSALVAKTGIALLQHIVTECTWANR